MFPCDTAQLVHVRRFAGEYYESAGCSADIVECTRLVASELATNSIQHAGTDFTVTCEVVERDDGPDAGRISIRDSAPGSLPVLPGSDRPAIGGHGLSLIALLGAAWGVEQGEAWKTVWCEVELDPQQGVPGHVPSLNREPTVPAPVASGP